MGLPIGAGPQHRPQVRAEHVLLPQGEAQAPAAQEGVFLVGLVEVGQRLVAAHVQGADDHPLAPHGSQNLPVGVELFLLPRLGGAV